MPKETDELRRIVESYEPCCEQELQDRRMMLKYMDMFDDVLLRTNETAHMTASSWVVNPEHTRTLMVYHNIYRSWSWTGGHADGEDDLLSVAIREAKEETGIASIRPVSLQPYSLEILPVNAHFKRGRFVVPHLHLNLTYLLEAEDNQMLTVKQDENSGVCWFTLDEAIEKCSEADMKIVYRKLNDKLGVFGGKK